MLGGRSFAAAGDELLETILEVTLGADLKGDVMVVLRGPGGLLYLDATDFEKLHLHEPDVAALERDGHRYFAPAALEGCRVTIDESRQRAVIAAPAAALETTRLSAADRQRPGVTPAGSGAFFNYQVSAQQIQDTNSGGVSGELGLFAAAGVLTNTVVARYDGATREFLRLDTTFTHDFPDRLETSSLGDAISDPGTWGNAVRFAGVRWSRNFGLRPDLLTTPLLSAGGMATVPSTADVFVNNQLVASSQVPAGPFVVDRLPTVSGTGDVSVVVRDALGREQIVSQTFYASTVLLARDLSQYSVNIGSVREVYALRSNHYGATLGEVSYRRGITDRLTLEGHGEYLAGDAHAAGVAAGLAVGHLGILDVTLAGGGDARGSGWLSGVGVEHRGQNTSFVASSSWASADFAQVGGPLDTASRMRRRSLAQVGAGLGSFGSLSLAYVRETYRSSPTQQTLSLTHGISFGGAGTVNLTVSHARSAGSAATAAQRSTSVYLTYVLAFGGRSTVSTTAAGGSGPGAPDGDLRTTLAESPPVGPGSGYRLSASTTGNYDADWRQQLSGADVELEVARNQGIDGRSAYVTGALTWLDGHVDPTRTVTGSFAMVDVAGLADVPVYVDNQLTTHTDGSGKALLYNLRPYEANRVSISPTELPLDTAIASTSTLIVPPFRSGVVARFPIERIRSATFRLLTDEGRPVPVGAGVVLKDTSFPVVLDGFVYVTGYDRGMPGKATWPGGHCAFDLELPPQDEPLPDMGTILCHR